MAAGIIGHSALTATIDHCTVDTGQSTWPDQTVRSEPIEPCTPCVNAKDCPGVAYTHDCMVGGANRPEARKVMKPTEFARTVVL
jgi:hypothetical protein